MKKRIVLSFIFLISIFFITGCESNNKNDIAKKAKLLDWKNVYKEISSNGAKATDYNDKWFIFTGTVTNIKEDSCEIFTERTLDGNPVNGITVYMKTDELKKLKDDQSLSVVGKANFTDDSNELKQAFVFPKELYNDKHFQIELVSTQDRDYTPHYFSDYEFDSKGNKTKYTEISYGITIKGHKQIKQQDTDKYTLKYNDKNQLISEQKKSFVNKGAGDITAGSKETTYTYNEDGFVSTVTVPSIYKGEDFTVYQYTYEKDSNGKIIKGTKNSAHSGTVTYEYDKNGNIIKEIGQTTTYTYKYDGKRLDRKKGVYNSSSSENENTKYYYGVVGIK